MNQLDDFQEERIVPKNKALEKFVKRIEERGFKFHPGEVLSAIDREVKAQFIKLADECLSGLSVENLTEIQTETYAWMQKEDDRFAQWKQECAKAAQVMHSSPDTVLESPVVNEKHEATVTEIKSKTKRKK